MRIRSYRSFKVDELVSVEAAERYRTLKAYRRLRDSGCDEAGALEHVGISRRTPYRRKVARVYARAAAGNARRFLANLLGTLPFPLLSIQVDGGSEFMAGFEDACEELGVPLDVLPPRGPQFIGCVERANRSTQSSSGASTTERTSSNRAYSR